jgi:hypothetical protein
MSSRHPSATERRPPRLRRGRLLLAPLVAILVAATTAAAGRPAVTGEQTGATTITTSPASAVGRNEATIQVTLSSTESGQWELDYGTSTAYGQSLGRTGFSPGTETMTYKLQRLQPGTTYHVRAIAQTPSFPPFTTTVDSTDTTFTTAPPTKPTVRILTVQTPADCGCASVRTGFGFGGLPTHIHIEYGTTPRLGTITDSKTFPAWMDVSGQGLAQTLDVPANGHLKPGGKYVLRVVASNKLGRTTSPTQPFTIPTRA